MPPASTLPKMEKQMVYRTRWIMIVFALMVVLPSMNINAAGNSAESPPYPPPVAEPIGRLEQPEQPEFVSGRLLVKFKNSTRQTQIAATLNTLGMTQSEAFSHTGISLIQINDASELGITDAIDALQAQMGALIEYAEPDYILSIPEQMEPQADGLNINVLPDDELFDALWGLNNTGQTGGSADADIDALEAWEITTGNSEIVVAVIDTGIDYTHPDLAANMWVNPGETPNDGIDNDGNGYIDDVYGLDTVNDDSDPMDDNAHGTHVAGTIAAVGDNNEGVTGTAWQAKVMALKFLDEYGWGSTSDVIEAIEYAIDMKVNHGVNLLLTNNSWGGGGYSQALYDAIEASGNSGILFVAAAGNSASDNDYYETYPSSYDLDSIIAVASTNHDDTLSYFSSYGATTVDLSAPGSNILSTFPVEHPDGPYYAISGTSMATPHVLGALVLAATQFPDVTIDQLKARVMYTTDSIPALNGKTVSGGRLNLHTMLTAQLFAPFNVQASDYVTGTSITVTWDALNADSFELFRGVDPNPDNSTQIATLTTTSYADNAVNAGTLYYYWVKAINADGTSPFSAPDTGFIMPGCGNVTEIPLAECEALEAVFNSTQGRNWTTKTNWLQTETPCSWYGVTCEAGHVSQLSLSSNRLNGQLPAEIGNLTSLTALYLGGNQLSGSIPAEIGNLTHLTDLYLFYNQLNGSIPPEIGTLMSLASLHLDGNQLSGAIPAEIGNLSNLTDLYLPYNQLSGAIPIEIGNLASLTTLYLDDNQLSGMIPSELGNLTNLRGLYLSYNQLSGAIPPEMGNLTELTTLYLYNNQLDGAIPSEIGNLANLATLYLHNNRLNGAIPAEIGNLTSLVELALLNNQLSGSIPVEIGNLINLRTLYLDNNEFSGVIPTEIGNLTNLDYLFLYANSNLSGALPSSLLNLDLYYFWFYDTQLCEPADAPFQDWLTTIPSTLGTDVLCNISPFENCATHTGNNATVILPNDVSIINDGLTLAAGDEIALFASDNLCAGVGVWDGNNLAITAWGDNAQTRAKDGLANGESIQLRIWNQSDGSEYDNVDAVYTVGDGIYSSNSIHRIGELDFNPTVEQVVSLAQGWNMISSYAVLNPANLETVLTEVDDALVIMKNNEGQVYAPSVGINNIGDWNSDEAYQLYMQETVSLTLHGEMIDISTHTIALPAGWSMIPFYATVPMAIEESLASLDNALVLVKNNGGQVYLPADGIDQIGNMQPGEGYQLYLDAPATLAYPQAGFATTRQHSSMPPTHFTDCTTRTGNNATVVILQDAGLTVNGQALVTGDEVAAMRSNDAQCVGVAVWTGENIALTVWGDDMQTVDEVDGLAMNEALQFRVWQQATDSEHELSVAFETGGGFYQPDALYTIHAPSTGVGLLSTQTTTTSMVLSQAVLLLLIMTGAVALLTVKREHLL